MYRDSKSQQKLEVEIMRCTEKIKLIEEVFERFHNEDEDMDCIDVCMAIEQILARK